MSSTFTMPNLTYRISNSYDSVLTVLGLTISLLLVFILILKELLRTYEGPRVNRWKRAVHIAALILSLCFVIIIATRLLIFLQ